MFSASSQLQALSSILESILQTADCMEQTRKFCRPFVELKGHRLFAYLVADSRFLSQISFKYLNKLNKTKDPINNSERNWNKDTNYNNCSLTCCNLVLHFCCVVDKLTTSQRCTFPNPGICAYVTLHSKRTLCLEIGTSSWIMLVGSI